MPVDFDTGCFSQLHYWRKHPNLHGWMEQLNCNKGGRAESFNCVNVVLTLDDLERFEADIKANALPDTSGLSSARPMEPRLGDLAFVAKAREAIKAGACVCGYPILIMERPA